MLDWRECANQLDEAYSALDRAADCVDDTNEQAQIVKLRNQVEVLAGAATDKADEEEAKEAEEAAQEDESTDNDN